MNEPHRHRSPAAHSKPDAEAPPSPGLSRPFPFRRQTAVLAPKPPVSPRPIRSEGRAGGR